MHNSYFHIVMVIMGDECLLSQQGSRLVVVALHVCGGFGGHERGCVKKGRGQGVRRYRKCPERQREWGTETKSVTGKNAASILS